MDDATVRSVIESVIADRFPGGAVESIRVREDTDYQGDPILVIDLIVRDRRLDASRTAGLARHLRAKLAEIGETTFPLFSFISKTEAGKLKSEAA